MEQVKFILTIWLWTRYLKYYFEYHHVISESCLDQHVINIQNLLMSYLTLFFELSVFYTYTMSQFRLGTFQVLSSHMWPVAMASRSGQLWHETSPWDCLIDTSTLAPKCLKPKLVTPLQTGRTMLNSAEAPKERKKAWRGNNAGLQSLCTLFLKGFHFRALWLILCTYEYI